MFFRKAVVATAPPTLEDKLATANSVAGMHLTAFANAASGLEAQAAVLDQIRDHAADEARRHTQIKVDADTAAFVHRERAQKIRDLIA